MDRAIYCRYMSIGLKSLYGEYQNATVSNSVSHSHLRGARFPGHRSSTANEFSQSRRRQGGRGPVATGVHLDKTKVEEVYLSDHTLDMMVKVLEQSDGEIKFRIPPSVKPGRLQLVVKTAGKNALILEQPVYITVEEEKEKERTEVATASNR